MHDIAMVGAEIAGISGLYANGRLVGWAAPCQGRARSLSIHLSGEKIGTALADEYRLTSPIGQSRFVGFSIRLSVEILKRAEGKILEAKDATTGDCVASLPFEKLPRLRVARRGNLPTDVVVPLTLDDIFDERSIQCFVGKYGCEDFVRIAYLYILERLPAQSDLESFTQQLNASEIDPADLMEGLLGSDERVRKGPFLGPRVADNSYPFALAPRGIRGDVPKRAQDRKRRVERVKKTLARPSGGSLLSPTNLHYSHQSGRVAAFRRRKFIAHFIGWLLRDTTRRILTLADDARDGRDWHIARELYQEVLSLDPTLHGIWVQYGHAQKEVGELAHAEMSYRKALSINDTTADTYLQLGHVLKLQGKLEEAREAYGNAMMMSGAGESVREDARVELANIS